MLFLDTNYQGLSCEYFLFRAKKAEEELERAKELLKRREPPEELRRSLSKEDREILRQSVFINVKEKNEIEILKLKIIVSQSLCAPLEVRWGKWLTIKRCFNTYSSEHLFIYSLLHPHSPPSPSTPISNLSFIAVLPSITLSLSLLFRHTCG